MDDLQIDTAKALEFLLKEKYFYEFRSINNLNQHPEGTNFYEWLHKRELISTKKLFEISEKLSKSE